MQWEQAKRTLTETGALTFEQHRLSGYEGKLNVAVLDANLTVRFMNSLRCADDARDEIVLNVMALNSTYSAHAEVHEVGCKRLAPRATQMEPDTLEQFLENLKMYAERVAMKEARRQRKKEKTSGTTDEKRAEKTSGKRKAPEHAEQPATVFVAKTCSKHR